MLWLKYLIFGFSCCGVGFCLGLFASRSFFFQDAMDAHTSILWSYRERFYGMGLGKTWDSVEEIVNEELRESRNSH